MPVDIVCTVCHSRWQAPEEWRGKSIDCPECGVPDKIPANVSEPGIFSEDEIKRGVVSLSNAAVAVTKPHDNQKISKNASLDKKGNRRLMGIFVGGLLLTGGGIIVAGILSFLGAWVETAIPEYGVSVLAPIAMQETPAHEVAGSKSKLMRCQVGDMEYVMAVFEFATTPIESTDTLIRQSGISSFPSSGAKIKRGQKVSMAGIQFEETIVSTATDGAVIRAGWLGPKLYVFMVGSFTREIKPTAYQAEKFFASVRIERKVDSSSQPKLAGSGTTPFLDERMSISPRMEWNKGITSPKGGAFRFQVISKGPFGVTVITDKAHQAMLAKTLGRIGKEELLFTTDVKGTEFEKSMKVPPGPFWIIMENQTDKPVEFHLVCFVE